MRNQDLLKKPNEKLRYVMENKNLNVQANERVEGIVTGFEFPNTATMFIRLISKQIKIGNASTP
jgi:hypothetical protein